MAMEAAVDLGVDQYLHQGVYAMLGGPNFETVAELKMLRICGVDAVGKDAIKSEREEACCGLEVATG